MLKVFVSVYAWEINSPLKIDWTKIERCLGLLDELNQNIEPSDSIQRRRLIVTVTVHESVESLLNSVVQLQLQLQLQTQLLPTHTETAEIVERGR